MPKDFRIINISDIKSQITNHQDCTVVFGGTFDPIHQGHILAIKQLSSLFKRVLIAPTPLNPWKSSKPSELQHRIELIKLARKNFFDFENVELHIQSYTYAIEVVEELISKNSDGDLFWAVGLDIAESVVNWKDWNKYKISIVAIPIQPNIHASDIRENPELLLDCLKEYASKNDLYGVNS